MRLLSSTAIFAGISLFFASAPVAGAQQAAKKPAGQAAQKSAAASPSSGAGAAQGTMREVYKDETVTVTLDTKNTKKQSGRIYLAHILWTYSTDQRIEQQDKRYRTMEEDRLLNCANGTSKPVNAIVRDAKGKNVSWFTTPTADLKYLEWAKRDPNTPNAKALANICKLLK